VVEDDFEQYVLNQSTRLLRTAYLLTGDQGRAEDLVQDSLVATYRQLSRIRDVCALDAYVRTTMGHTLVSWTRRPVGRRERPASDELERMSLAAPADQDESGDEVWAAVCALPDRQRAVVVLRYCDDLTEAETATTLGCSARTVKSHAHRALARLASILRTRAAAEATTDHGRKVRERHRSNVREYARIRKPARSITDLPRAVARRITPRFVEHAQATRNGCSHSAKMTSPDSPSGSAPPESSSRRITLVRSSTRSRTPWVSTDSSAWSARLEPTTSSDW
jgi:RNA polymerase sigma factor, sigma-70 family/RNA polymerase sigma-70 factor, sigma-E family